MQYRLKDSHLQKINAGDLANIYLSVSYLVRGFYNILYVAGIAENKRSVSRLGFSRETTSYSLNLSCLSIKIPPGGGILLYMGSMGMCRPIVYGFGSSRSLKRVSFCLICQCVPGLILRNGLKLKRLRSKVNVSAEIFRK